MDTAVQEEESK